MTYFDRYNVKYKEQDKFLAIETQYERMLESGDRFPHTIYEVSTNLLSEIKYLLNTFTQEDLDKLVLKDDRKRGLFLSALHNIIPLKEIRGQFQDEEIGYRLNQNKHLILEKGSEIESLGYESKGNIDNFGECIHFGFKTYSGIYNNFNFADQMGGISNDGIFNNFGEVGKSMGCFSKDRIFNNFGIIKGELGKSAESTICNFGEANTVHKENEDIKEYLFQEKGLFQFTELKGKDLVEAVKGYNWRGIL